jgi:hypothetical protein
LSKKFGPFVGTYSSAFGSKVNFTLEFEEEDTGVKGKLFPGVEMLVGSDKSQAVSVFKVSMSLYMFCEECCGEVHLLALLDSKVGL